MSLVSLLRNRDLAARCTRREREYEGHWTPDARMAWQLARINECWPHQRATIPAFREAVGGARLPDRFESIDHFLAAMRPTTKRMVQTRMDELTDPSRPADVHLPSGGSTSEPILFPSWREESSRSTPDRWLCRRWYGVRPADKLFLIWGHHHLLGRGIKARLNALARACKDHLLGYHRFSAYHLDDARLREAGDVLLRFRPAYIVGYSAAIDALCRANADRADEFHALRLKMAMATSESFPDPDSPRLVNRTLGCPCAMEYGSIETGILGATRPVADGLGHFDLLWRSYLVDAGETGPAGGTLIRVTSLSHRKLPLMRFEIGDEVDLFDGDDPRSLARVKAIVGKSHNFLTLPDGTRAHSIVFEHAARAVPGIRRFQVVSRAQVVTLKVVAPDTPHDQVDVALRALMRRIHPSLEAARIEHTDRLVQTIAGKTPTLVLDDAATPLTPHRPSVTPR